MSTDELEKETGSSDGLRPKQSDLSCVHALNELHLHEIHVVPSMHEADQCGRLSAPERIALSARVFIEKFQSQHYYFPIDSGNDGDSSDGLVATQNEEVATLEKNVFSEDALLRKDTWEIVELHRGRKAIGSKWIYTIKFKSSGEINRYKARLVAQDFGQKEGIDYEETFSPVVKMVTVRCLLNIDAPRQWNAKLTSTLIENGFGQKKFDYSIYKIEKFKVFLKSKFMIKDLGKLKYFPGIEVVDTD
nr:hypothetical protein [Tanacetum cinerariifolium]